MNATKYKIPFNRPAIVGDELANISAAIQNGHASGDGDFTRKCHDLLERLIGAPRVLLTTSCTHALEMAALLLDLKPGDEVIVPSFTFVSTVNAFVLRGAVPVFADIRPDTLNIDEDRLPDLITARTKAIVVVHYAGVACNMDAIVRLAAEHDLAVVEDNAHGLFGRYRGRPLGSFGALATQSFHETKNITCGEGGALVVNDPSYIERAEIIREKGTDRSKFFRGEVDKYTWVDVGSSYLPSDLLAAFLYAQLEASDDTQLKRRRVWERYHQGLSAWAREHGVGTPVVPAECEHPSHMYYLVMPSEQVRNELMLRLRGLGILSTFHYQPLHLSAMGQRFGGKTGDCPVTESICNRLVRLPFYSDLGERSQNQVIDGVLSLRAARSSIVACAG